MFSSFLVADECAYAACNSSAVAGAPVVSGSATSIPNKFNFILGENERYSLQNLIHQPQNCPVTASGIRTCEFPIYSQAAVLRVDVYFFYINAFS